MELFLNWKGPIGAGGFPDPVPEREALAVPGVYLRLKRYEGGRRIAYVGQSVNLLSRFDQHLRDILTFATVIRNDAGDIVIPRHGGDRIAAYNRLPEVMPLVAAEAGRTVFFYARCDDGFDPEYLSAVEALLKQRLEERLGTAFQSLENLQGISTGGLDSDITIYSCFDAPGENDAAMVADLLGAAAIRFSLPALEEEF